eukprot:scaffold19953_cov69-Cylindrotheca_fusiformis.AAC.1
MSSACLYAFCEISGDTRSREPSHESTASIPACLSTSPTSTSYERLNFSSLLLLPTANVRVALTIDMIVAHDHQIKYENGQYTVADGHAWLPWKNKEQCTVYPPQTLKIQDGLLNLPPDQDRMHLNYDFDAMKDLERTKSEDSPASSLLLEADREDQIPVTLPVTPQVIVDVTSSPTGDTRLQGAKRSYVEVARSSLD